MRAGLTPAERAEIKSAYQAIHRTGIGQNDAIAYLQNVKTDAGRRLLEFFASGSGRGAGVRASKPLRAA
jgi:hypothetical protein